MKHKIQKTIKDGLTHLHCTGCGTGDKFETFDDTKKFKSHIHSGDWEQKIKISITCSTCMRSTMYCSLNETECYYE